MRLPCAVALVVGTLALAAHAQRGGGARGGFGGHSAGSAFHGGPYGRTPGAPSRFFGSPSFRPAPFGAGPFSRATFPGYRGSAYRPGYTPGGFGSRSFSPRPFVSGLRGGRPSSLRGALGVQRGAFGYRGGRLGYGSHRGAARAGIFGYPAFVNFGFFDPFWMDADQDGVSRSYDPTYGAWAAPDAGPYDAYGMAGVPQGYGYPAAGTDPAEQDAYAYPAPTAGNSTMVYAPGMVQPPPQVTVITLPPPQREEDAITIFFRDGRPPEQVRNYALTRSALLITSPRLREIPLDQVDLPLTERVNQAIGVEFRLPDAR